MPIEHITLARAPKIEDTGKQLTIGSCLKGNGSSFVQSRERSLPTPRSEPGPMSERNRNRMSTRSQSSPPRSCM